MELWIRSQDKEILTICRDLCVGGEKENKIIGDAGVPLGEYESKERALEVLDEIQKLLIPKTIMGTYNVDEAEMLDGTIFIKSMLGDIKIEGCMSYIYEMPKE